MKVGKVGLYTLVIVMIVSLACIFIITSLPLDKISSDKESLMLQEVNVTPDPEFDKDFLYSASQITHYAIDEVILNEFLRLGIYTLSTGSPMTYRNDYKAPIWEDPEEEIIEDEMIPEGGFNKAEAVFYLATEMDAVLPVDKKMYDIASEYGSRLHPVDDVERMHYGVDISMKDESDNNIIDGQDVYAFYDGVIESVSYDSALGNYIIIRHPKGITTKYAHLKKVSTSLRIGDMVSKGDLIALVGDTGKVTGPHLHFEIAINDMSIDPLPFLKKAYEKQSMYATP